MSHNDIRLGPTREMFDQEMERHWKNKPKINIFNRQEYDELLNYVHKEVFTINSIDCQAVTKLKAQELNSDYNLVFPKSSGLESYIMKMTLGVKPKSDIPVKELVFFGEYAHLDVNREISANILRFTVSDKEKKVEDRGYKSSEVALDIAVNRSGKKVYKSIFYDLVFEQ